MTPRGVLMNKQTALVYLLIFGCGALLSHGEQMFRLGDTSVSRAEYEAALPYIHAENVRLRDFPSTTDSAIVATLQQGTRLDIWSVTEETEKIGDKEAHWLQVQTRDDESLHGWVYGGFVSFQAEYPLEFWNPGILSPHLLNRKRFIMQLHAFLDQSLLPNGDLAQYAVDNTPEVISESREGWGDAECDHVFLTFKTGFGHVCLSGCRNLETYILESTRIITPVRGEDITLMININDSLAKLESLFGNRYTREDNMISFLQGLEDMSDYLTFKIKDDKVVEIYLISSL